MKRYYIFHPQLKYFCGKKDYKYWSANANSVRLFTRKCDASNCIKQTASYWELKGSVVKEATVEL